MSTKPKWDDPTTNLIGEIYKSACGLSESYRALEVLCELTESDKAFIASHDFDAKRGRILNSFNMETHFIDNYLEVYSPANPWLHNRDFFQVEGLVWMGDSLVPRDKLEHSEFFNLFMAPQAMAETVHGVVESGPQTVEHLYLSKTPDSASFTDRDLAIVKLFIAQVQNAKAIRRPVQEAATAQNMLGNYFAAQRMGIAIISESGLLFCNRLCHEIFESHCANGGHSGERLWITYGRGRRRSLSLPSAVMREVSGVLNRGLPSSLNVEGEDGYAQLMVNLYPYRDDDEASDEPLVLLTAVDPEASIEFDEASLHQRFGITGAEARVCTGLANGHRIEAVAEDLGITANTARTHLKRIFEKTSMSRQAELVRILLRTSRVRLAPQTLEAKREPKPQLFAADASIDSILKRISGES